MNTTYTIKEIVRIYNININTLYKKIKQNKIPVLHRQINNKIVKCIKKEDIEGFLLSSSPENKIENEYKAENESIKYNTITPEFLLQLREDSYKIGKMETENQFLRERLEVLYRENQELQEKIKFLPDKEQIKKIQIENQDLNNKLLIMQEEKEKETNDLQYKISQVEILEKEKEDLLSKAETIQKEKEEQIRKAEGLNQVLLDNANNIKELAKEKDNFQSALKEQEATIREKERALKDLEELHRAELEQVLKQAEKKQIEISEAWKKELELAKRPWWKFW